MSQPQFRLAEGPQASRTRRKGGGGENVREFHRARIPMGSRGRFLDYVRSELLIETYMARKRMAHSALRKYVSLERTALMGAFSYLSLFRVARLLQIHVLHVSLPHVHGLPNIHPKHQPINFFLYSFI